MNNTLLIIWPILFGLYYPLNRRKNCKYIKFGIDDRVPLIPIFTIPYLSFYLWIFIPILLFWNKSILTPFLIAQVIATFTATIVWTIFPTGVKRPNSLSSTNIFNKLLKIIYTHDHDVNACPSSHVFTSLISSYYLATFSPSNFFLIYAVGTLISLSTIFTKQHYIVDVLVGVIWAIISIYIGQMIFQAI